MLSRSLRGSEGSQPHTVFVEPVNLRLNARRACGTRAQRQGHDIDMTPYSDSLAWSDYAIRTLRLAERAADGANATGTSERLHLWPDHKALSLKSVIERQADSGE